MHGCDFSREQTLAYYPSISLPCGLGAMISFYDMLLDGIIKVVSFFSDLIFRGKGDVVWTYEICPLCHQLSVVIGG